MRNSGALDPAVKPGTPVGTNPDDRPLRTLYIASCSSLSKTYRLIAFYRGACPCSRRRTGVVYERSGFRETPVCGSAAEARPGAPGNNGHRSATEPGTCGDRGGGDAVGADADRRR